MLQADNAIQDLLAREVLQPAIVERALDRALELLARPAAGRPDRSATERRLAQVERELANLSATAARGGAVPAILEALAARDAERRQLASMLAATDAPKAVTESPRQLRAQLRAMLADWRGLLSGDTAEARALLTRVLAGRIAFTPIGDGRYELTVPVGFGRVMSAALPSLRVLQDMEASLSVPSWNQIGAFLRQMKELQDSAHFAA